MPCFAPIRAFWGAVLTKSGRRPLVFKQKDAIREDAVKIPCGQCVGCRLESARTWAIRCMHEKRVGGGDSAFLTLTYDDAHLPADGGLVKRDLQLFMKRLRRSRGDGIRFFGCGEYGGLTRRPHYHVLLFNVAFPDQRFYKLAKRGERLYHSQELELLWPCGLSVIGDVTFDSCCYVARYICDKMTGEGSELYYSKVSRYGVITDIEKEFCVMSRRPGIGSAFFDRFKDETYAHDSVLINGMEVTPPRYYDTKYESVDLARLEVLKRARRARGELNAAENTPDRRRVREQVVKLNLSRNRRDVT